MTKFTMPIKAQNEQNGSHGNHHAKNGRRQQTKGVVRLAMKKRFTPSVLLVVRLTRVGAGTMDDDGLRAALKSVRDGVAGALRIDDGSPLISFEYFQRQCERGEWAVEVEIEAAQGPGDVSPDVTLDGALRDIDRARAAVEHLVATRSTK